jgi:hypothetical protein
LQHLTLDGSVETGAFDLIFFLTMRNQARLDSPALRVSIGGSVVDATGFAQLQANIAAWQLHKVQLIRV